MEVARRLGLPVVARGQPEASVQAIEACLALPVPMVAVIVGEGGSSGAVALASADLLQIPEHR